MYYTEEIDLDMPLYVHGQDIIKSDWGYFASVETLIRWVLDHPYMISNSAEILRFEWFWKDDDKHLRKLWVVYTICELDDEKACDHTIWRIDKQREKDGLPPLTEAEWDTIEPDHTDCEMQEDLDFEYIELIKFL